jgi:uncharacterized protein (TIGR00725 family)
MILVSGGAQATALDLERAEAVGRLLAQAGAVVLTGGGGGVMAAASRGARSAGGVVLAVLPGTDEASSPPNPHVEIALFTGMGDARNAILVASADAVIAIGGAWGTLSEIALAGKAGRPVVLLESWRIAPPAGSSAGEPRAASTPEEAVGTALASVRRA